MRHYTSFILLLTFSLSLFSCSESSTEPEVDLSKFVFTSADNWLRDGEEGIVFVSDTNGNILAEAEWTGNATIELKKADGSDLPERLNFTTIRLNDYAEFITSYLNINSKRWTYRGYNFFDNVYQVQLNFNNIPNHDRYSLGSANITRTGNYLFSRSYDIFFNPDDFLITLSTLDSGRKYTWLPNVETDSTYNVDLSNMMTMKSGKVNLSEPSSNLSLHMSGYLEANNRTSSSYYLDSYSNFGDSVISQIPYYYVQSPFQEYRTTITLYDDDNRGDRYQSNYGAPISNFEKIDADFNFVNVTDSTLKINATGEFDLFSSGWYHRSSERSIIIYISSGSDQSEHYLSKFPQMVYDRFPEIKMGSFDMQFGLLKDYIGADSYDSFIEQTFGSGRRTAEVFDNYFGRGKYIDDNTFRKRINNQKGLLEEEFLNPYRR